MPSFPIVSATICETAKLRYHLWWVGITYQGASRPGLEKALAALWPAVLVQRCTVHKHRNLLAHAPDRLHEELSADYREMIYAATKHEVENGA